MFSSYLDSLKKQKVSVIGAGVSNTPLIKLLSGHGIAVTVYDKRPVESFDKELLSDFEKSGVSLVCGEGYLDKIDGDVIFRTPGVRPDAGGIPEAVRRGAVVTSEMDLFFRFCPCPITAVTGSDGKTTTSTLIAELLSAQGKKVFLGGNIGAPLLPRLSEMKESDRVVVELSSFQLFDMTRSPHTAVITNVTPNHLDWHRGMEEYKEAKFNVLAHQTENDVAVLNFDDETTRAFAGRTRSEVRFFSLAGDEGCCAFFKNGTLYLDGSPLIPASSLRIRGMHNVANFLTAAAAVKDEVTRETMAYVAQSFKGVEHRLEVVRSVNGADFYNGAIGSSPTRTIAGLKCFDGRMILIAGGYDKHIAFDTLGDEICRRVSVLLLCGATADKIEAAVKASIVPEEPEIMRFSDLTETVRAAKDLSRPGDTVLFSPACASFDQFPNFAVRGRFFKDLVNKL